MTVETDVKETNFSELFPEDKKQFSNGEPSTTGKRTRKPRGTTTRVATISKDAVKSALELANLGLVLSYKELALTPIEIAELTDAWYEIIKQYPSVGKYLVVGQKLGMWGNLAFIHYQIVMRRYNYIAEQRNKSANNQSGTARPTSGNDGQRQDDVSGTVASVAS